MQDKPGLCIEVLGPLLSSGRAMKTSGWCIRHRKQLDQNKVIMYAAAKLNRGVNMSYFTRSAGLTSFMHLLIVLVVHMPL